MHQSSSLFKNVFKSYYFRIPLKYVPSNVADSHFFVHCSTETAQRGRAIAHVICSTCALPAVTCQSVLSHKRPFKVPL